MHILAISPGSPVDEPKWEAVALSGIDALMIREKHLDARSLLTLGRRIRGIAPRLALWINGRLDVALALGAGLHGGEDYPQAPPGLCAVSRPLHSISQVQCRLDTDQLLISPIFDVPGKGAPMGPGGLHDILDNMPPWQGKLLALGGIDADNAAALKHRRLDGVALIRGLWDSSSPTDAVDRLRRAWGGSKC
jgi:thiamine-phosphate pyrophosphorylase